MQNSKVLVTQRPYVDLAVLKYHLIVELTCGNSLGRRYTNVMTAFLLFLSHGRHYLYCLLPFFQLDAKLYYFLEAKRIIMHFKYMLIFFSIILRYSDIFLSYILLYFTYCVLSISFRICNI